MALQVKAILSPFHIPHLPIIQDMRSRMVDTASHQHNMVLFVAPHVGKLAVFGTYGCAGKNAPSPKSLTHTGPVTPTCTSRARTHQRYPRNIHAKLQSQTHAACSEAAKDLLDWLADRPGAPQPAVMLDTSPSTAGRRLKANRDLTADEVLLSVPLTHVFADTEVCCHLCVMVD